MKLNQKFLFREVNYEDRNEALMEAKQVDWFSKIGREYHDRRWKIIDDFNRAQYMLLTVTRFKIKATAIMSYDPNYIDGHETLLPLLFGVPNN